MFQFLSHCSYRRRYPYMEMSEWDFFNIANFHLLGSLCSHSIWFAQYTNNHIEVHEYLLYQSPLRNQTFNFSIVWFAAGMAVAYSAPSRHGCLKVVENNCCASKRGMCNMSMFDFIGFVIVLFLQPPFLNLYVKVFVGAWKKLEHINTISCGLDVSVTYLVCWVLKTMLNSLSFVLFFTFPWVCMCGHAFLQHMHVWGVGNNSFSII